MATGILSNPSDELSTPFWRYRVNHEPLIVYSKAVSEIGKMLSNFYPCDISYEGRVFPSVEHAYHAMKANDDDVVQREQFRDVFSRFENNDLFCGEDNGGVAAKDAAGRIWNMRGGRNPENWRLKFDAAAEDLDSKGRKAIIAKDSKGSDRKQWSVKKHADWRENYQLPIMRELLRLKFFVPEFRDALLSTGNRDLHHTGDAFWGMGSKNRRCGNKGGKNMHGVLLMELRDELRDEL
eukprot:TRINITY_DN76825_c0_g1_i1.p1 TRINITY_DN76825_c0_g1~~TRINITY_DN76825_c0_g1_i1.p1  ORF type:complete len:257 (-),score=46.10 TRINITY_DN76825_c0_g1_i1:554-1264(-)